MLKDQQLSHPTRALCAQDCRRWQLPSAAQFFADDIVLQLESDFAAEIALRALSDWADNLLMNFNMKHEKSMELIKEGNVLSAWRTLNGDALRGSPSDQYLGVGPTARETGPGPILNIVDGAPARLATPRYTKHLLR